MSTVFTWEMGIFLGLNAQEGKIELIFAIPGQVHGSEHQDPTVLR
jgi:hypothetical protein